MSKRTQHTINHFISPDTSILGKRGTDEREVSSPSPTRKRGRGPCTPKLGDYQQSNDISPTLVKPIIHSFNKALDYAQQKKANSPPKTNSNSNSSVKLTKEQLELIERNRKIALERRAKNSTSFGRSELPLKSLQPVNPYSSTQLPQPQEISPIQETNYSQPIIRSSKPISKPQFTPSPPRNENTNTNKNKLSISPPKPNYPFKKPSPIHIIDPKKRPAKLIQTTISPSSLSPKERLPPSPKKNSTPVKSINLDFLDDEDDDEDLLLLEKTMEMEEFSSQQKNNNNNHVNENDYSQDLFPPTPMKETQSQSNQKSLYPSKTIPSQSKNNQNLQSIHQNYPSPSNSTIKEKNQSSYKMKAPPPSSMRKAITPKGRPKGSFSSNDGWQPLAINQREDTIIGDSLETYEFGGAGTNKLKQKYHWVKNPLDAQQRKPSDENYDPTTLFIPKSAYDSLTDTQRAYWEFKKKHFDTIVFYQGGSFYEIYGNDALIGAQLFDLKISEKIKSLPMAGFPLHAYDKFASKFVALGYKVARMDQALDKNSKLLPSRKLTDYQTRGTLIDSPLLGNQSNYLLSLYENKSTNQFGLCFIDCSTNQIYIGEFQDDHHYSHLKTLLLQIKPREIICLRNNLSKSSILWIKKLNDTTLTTIPIEKSNRWSKEYLDDYLHENYPNIIQNSSVYKSCNSNLCFCAWSGCIDYLNELNDLDKIIFSSGEILIYNMNDQNNHLILDGETLLNLEILENNNDHSSKQTLWGLMMNCSCGFGSRLFSQWICHPLYKIHEINERLDAVEELIDQKEIRNKIIKSLKKLPHLDRLLARIHTKTTSTLKLESVLEFMSGLEEIAILIETYGCLDDEDDKKQQNDNDDDDVIMTNDDDDDYRGPYKFKSSYLSRITCSVQDGGEFPNDICNIILQLSDGIDRNESLEKKIFVPRRGFNKKYDKAVDQVKSIKESIDNRLINIKKQLGISTIKYTHTSKQKYLIEINNKFLSNITIPSYLDEVTKLKQVTRFYDSSISEILIQLADAEENLEIVAASQLHEFIDKLDEYYNEFRSVIHCIAQLDCLISLAITSCSSGLHSMCRPKLIDHKDVSSSFINIHDMIHPFLNVSQDSEVIPNDILLGGDHPRGILLTGPNMGGKSTLLRQACIGIIMAQLGCFVPASSCELTPCDRIFTRIGANDNIFEGQSTFMVELQETAQILHNSTPHSFVILDELGRGTSTFDGTAIAHSVLYYLMYVQKTLLMFATHYHLLIDDWKDNDLLALYHMSCFEDIDEKMVTFLYKSVIGACPTSRGMNVARMAHIPEDIILNAERISKNFEISFGTKREVLIQKILSLINDSINSKIIAPELIEIRTALTTQYTRRWCKNG